MIPQWSFVEVTATPWWKENLYTDLDRSWDEAQIYKSAPSLSETGSLLYQFGKATVKKGAWRVFIGQQALLQGVYYSKQLLEGTEDYQARHGAQ